MMHRILLALAMSCVLVSPGVALALEKSGAKGKGEVNTSARESNAKGGKSDKPAEGAGSSDKPSTDSFTVVQVGDEVKVIKSSELGALREKVNEDYKAAVKAYEEAKKAAAKVKKKFTDARPVRPAVKTLATALKSEDDAKALRDKTALKIGEQRKKEREERIKAKQAG